VNDRPAVLRLEASGNSWDAFVARSHDATFCHLSGWRDIMADVLGHECHYAAAVDDEGSWCGILPLVRVRSALFGSYVVSMPFLNYGGPLGSVTAQERLSQFALLEARRFNAGLLELRNRELVPSVLRVHPRKIIVVLQLPKSSKELWDGFPSKLRSQIRRAMKAELEPRFGLDQIEPFYEVFSRNMRDLGTPVMPRSWFEAIGKTFPHLAHFGVVYHRGVPVAGGCGFLWRGEFEITWASALREFNQLAPNMLLYWSFMQHLIGLKAHTFNFGRCTQGGGTHRFKSQWGGTDVPLPWAQWSPGEVTATPSPDRRAYRVAAALWRHLPLPVTNRVGPVLARVIP
jgi:FemAB-related protein (PEP-CTERM system-associated)